MDSSCDCKQTTVLTWTWYCRVNGKFSEPQWSSSRNESKPAVETQISPTMMRGNSKSARRSHLTNAQRKAIVNEFGRRQNVGEDSVRLKRISRNGILKKSTSPPRQASPLFLHCARNYLIFMANESSIWTESWTRGNCIIKMLAQGVDGSSEMIKEMGIWILEGVNEMRPDEKKINLKFSNRRQRELRKTLAGAYRQTSEESYLTI